MPEWVSSLPSINASLNGLATLLLLLGLALIKANKPKAHERTMYTAFAVSIAFLCCYLVYHYYVRSKPFTGTGPIRIVYYTILVNHIILAATVPVLALITINHGRKQRWEKHKRIAKITFPIWLYVSVTGVIIYFMLYHWSPAA